MPSPAANGATGTTLALTTPAQTPQQQQQQGMLWHFANFCAETTRDDRIRWYTFISQCVISVMILAFAIAMLSKDRPGPTSIYLTIITGEAVNNHMVCTGFDQKGAE
jgi:hypothetical protein